MKRHTCAELGVCQGRPGEGCTCDAMDVSRGCAAGPDCTRHPFAPGVVERYRRRVSLPRVAGVLLEVAIVLGAIVLMGVASGFFRAKGWL